MMHAEDYRKIISMAVGAEIEAYEFYSDVSSKVSDPSLKSIFSDLAQEEKKHKQLLEGFLSSAKPMRFSEMGDYNVAQTIDKPKLTLSIKPAEAIALAIKNEEEAMLMYAELARSSADAEQKQMFESLSRMEQSHKVKLEDIYTSMAFPEVW
jgi:rubrerythrin